MKVRTIDKGGASAQSVPADGTIPDRAIADVLQRGVELFHDHRGDPFIAFRNESGRREIWPLASQDARGFTRISFYQAEDRGLSSEALNTAQGTLAAKARFEGSEIPLQVRVARLEDAFWYDLGDGRAVRVTREGWEVIEDPPILFRRYSHQIPQVEPVNGDIADIFSLLNIADERLRLLILVYLVAALVPDIPLPVIVVHDEQGSAKSFLLKVLKRLIDPSLIDLMIYPDNPREFAQLASHHRCVYFDNLSSLPQWLSDALCRLCTGDGFSKRGLYTNDDDFIYVLRGLGGISGINNVAERPDLLDRALLAPMLPIPDDRRLPERELWRRFDGLRPGILGAMFDVLCRAMTIKDEIELSRLPRIADFAEWGAAISVALGYDANDFIEAYGRNVESQNESAIEESLVAQAIIDFMKDKTEWEGTSTELLNALNAVAEALHIPTKDKKWPKRSNVLSRRLKEVTPNLRRIGIEVIRDERSADARKIRILHRSPENIVITVTTVTERMNTRESGMTISSPNDGVSSQPREVSSQH